MSERIALSYRGGLQRGRLCLRLALLLTAGSLFNAWQYPCAEAEGSKPAAAVEPAPLTAGFALLGPNFARGMSSSSAAAPILARARTALNRVPSVTQARPNIGAAQFLARQAALASAPQTNRSATPSPDAVPASTTAAIQAPAQAPSSTAGMAPAQRHGDDSRDVEAVFNLALAWRLTGERPFLDQAGKIFDAWATNYKIVFSPLSEDGFSGFFMAYDLTKKDLPNDVRAKMDDFTRRFATGYLEQMETGKVDIPQTLTNNWQSHRIELTTLAAFETGDAGLIARVHALFEKQIEANLYPDGSTLDFKQRDALHYVNYSLEPLMTAVLAAKVHGLDWYSFKSPSGSSIPNTLDWLAAFSRGQKSHIEFVNSVVPFDRQRAEAGGATYQPHPWDATESIQTYTIAALVDPKWKALRDTLLANPHPGTGWSAGTAPAIRIGDGGVVTGWAVFF